MYVDRSDFEKASLFEKGLADLAEYAKAAATAHGGVPTSKRRQDTAAQHTKLLASIKEYTDVALNSQMIGGNHDALATMCQLSVPMEKLTKHSDVGDVAALLKASEQFKKIKGQKGFAGIKALGEAIPLLMAQGEQSLEKCAAVLDGSKLRSDEWAAVTGDVFSLVGAVVDQPHLAALTEEHLEQIKRMLFAAEELETQQQQAVVDGEMKLSELLYFKKITLQESMVEIFKKVFEIIEAHQEECFVRPLKEVHSVHNKTNDRISEMIKAHEKLKKDAQEDLRRLKMTSLSLKNDDANISKQFSAYVASNNALLEANSKKQDQCFEAIQKLEKIIEELATERIGLVAERVAAIKKEQRRGADVAGYESFARDRTQLLVATLQTCEAADEATDLMDEFICNTCNAVEQHLRAVEADVEKRRADAHEMRLSHFRGLYLTLGELQYKKERNLEEIDKKIAHTHIQQDIAMDTLDPKAKEFAQLKKELIAVREDMESQLGVIQEKAQLQIEYFKPTEVALIEAGKDFKHPVAELEERLQVRQQRMLEYKRLMSPADAAEEEEGGDEGGDGSAFAESELLKIEQARAALQPRKPKTPLAGVASSLSASSAVRGGWAAELQPLPNKIVKNLTESPVGSPSKVDAAGRASTSGGLRASTSGRVRGDEVD